MPPSQHNPDTVQTGFWSNRELKKTVNKILKKEGKTLTSEIIKLMEDIAKREYKKEIKKNEK